MSNWKYSDRSNRSVSRIRPDGLEESMRVDAPEFLDWMAGGGVPDAADQPPLSALKNEAIAKVRDARKQIFATLAGIQAEALSTNDLVTASAIVPIQAALRNLPATDLSTCFSQADIDAVFLDAWKLIAVMAPLNVQTAFMEVLAS